MTDPRLPAIPDHPAEIPCIDLINTAFTHYLGKGRSFDRLPLPQWQAWFLERYGLNVDSHHPVPVKKLAVLRDHLRTILDKWATTGSISTRDTERLNRWVSSHPLRQRVTSVSGRLTLTTEPVTRDWEWVTGRIAASAVLLIADNAPERLKTCANPDCSWMFYDHTLNRSRQFCSTSPCGNVTRVRRFRDHRRCPRETEDGVGASVSPPNP